MLAPHPFALCFRPACPFSVPATCGRRAARGWPSDPPPNAVKGKWFQPLWNRLHFTTFADHATGAILPPLASGLWRDGGEIHADEVVIFEVLSKAEDRDWFVAYRERLAQDFRQKSILMMMQPVDVV